jgi:FdhD protein
MDDSKKRASSTKNVRAKRILTDGADVPPVDDEVCVIREAPLGIDVEGVETYTLLCTPSDELALAAGFLFGEGVIRSLQDVQVLKFCEDDPGTIRVRLAGEVPRIAGSGRNLMIVSSCGACGSENLKKRIDALPTAGDTLSVQPALLHSVYQELRKRQILFRQSGGAHAAALFDRQGGILSFAEDAGRHNALDKAIGKLLLEGRKTNGLGAALTSRLSLEMVSRCAAAGIELVAAVSAPTSLAIDVAHKCNITLCAFVRQTRATVFTHPGRITGA